MTISYRDNFLRVLFRWRGSAWKAVWKEMLLWLFLFYLIRIALHYSLITNEQHSKAKRIIQLFETFTRKVPLEFLLGFYVVQVVNRWWQQIEKIPWPDDVILWLNALFPSDDRETKLRKHTVARYLLLTLGLALQQISTRIRTRFPTAKKLVEAKLMNEEEFEIYEMYRKCAPNACWQLPLHWATHVIEEATTISNEPGKIPKVVANSTIGLVNKFAEDLRALFMYDWICIPLVYTQTVSVVVYGYFFGLCLIGHQHQGNEMDIFVPVLTALQFFFYVGWLKVAQDLMRPFGDDDDDVELNVLFDRHVSVSFALVHYACMKQPTMEEDSLFKNLTKTDKDGVLVMRSVQIPYSEESLKGGRDHPPKLHGTVQPANDEQAEMVFKPVWTTTTVDIGKENLADQEAAGPVGSGSFTKYWTKIGLCCGIFAPKEQTARKEPVYF